MNPYSDEFSKDLDAFQHSHARTTHENILISNAFHAGAISAMSILMKILISKQSLLNHEASSFVSKVQSHLNQ